MLKLANKPVVAVDIDDVLAANAEGIIKYTNERWGTNLRVEDYHEHWAELWQVDEEEMERRTHEFVSSGAPKEYRRLNKADEVLRELSKNYKLVITTSRRKVYAADTQEWLDKNLPGIFEEVHFVGIWDQVSEGRIKATKGEYAKQIGADYLIDDQLKHCESAAKVGIKALLFGDYTWNRSDKLPANIIRVKNWQEVLEYFDGRG